MAQYQPTQSQQQPPPVAGLAAGLRPHYFTSPRVPSSSTSSLLSGKHASVYPSPPSSPMLGPATPPFTSSEKLPTPQQALLASMASQTLVQRLGNAFWQAFTAHSPSSEATNASTPTWDADKIRRVLEGKAVVAIVDIEPEVKVPAAPVSPPTQALPNNIKTPESLKGCCVTTVLEESMRALSLSKE